MNRYRLRRTSLGVTMAAFLAVTLAVANSAAAQVAVKAEDVIGTWELVSAKDPKTGAVVFDTGNRLEQMQLTRSHWSVLSMQRDRSVVKAADFDKLSPEEKRNTNYARVWDDKGQQVFAARGGTYTLSGDKLHHTATIALYTSIIGVDRVLKITRLDKDTMVAQNEEPPELAAAIPAREYTYRRIE
jgi:hypothetical protein